MIHRGYPESPVESSTLQTTNQRVRTLTRRRTSGASLTIQPFARSHFGSVGFRFNREG
jgi:hypothetical protein